MISDAAEPTLNGAARTVPPAKSQRSRSTASAGPGSSWKATRPRVSGRPRSSRPIASCCPGGVVGGHSRSSLTTPLTWLKRAGPAVKARSSSSSSRSARDLRAGAPAERAVERDRAGDVLEQPGASTGASAPGCSWPGAKVSGASSTVAAPRPLAGSWRPRALSAKAPPGPVEPRRRRSAPRRPAAACRATRAARTRPACRHG